MSVQDINYIMHHITSQRTSIYICDMLNWYQPARTLRLASTTSLLPNRNRTIIYGRRLLDTSSAALWNPLPGYIKYADTIITVKTNLKTYMLSIDINYDVAFILYSVHVYNTTYYVLI